MEFECNDIGSEGEDRTNTMDKYLNRNKYASVNKFISSKQIPVEPKHQEVSLKDVN